MIAILYINAPLFEISQKLLPLYRCVTPKAIAPFQQLLRFCSQLLSRRGEGAEAWKDQLLSAPDDGRL